MSVEITDESFASGSLRIKSYVRPGKLFTANANLIVAEVGELNTKTFEGILEAIIRILTAGLPAEKKR